MLITVVSKTFLIFLLCVAVKSYASENSLGYLFSLTLEDLVNVEVQVASRFADKISESPGSLNLVTKQDLTAFGGNQLSQVLIRMPSTNLANGGRFFNNHIMIRGQSQQSWAHHTLYLINGRPIRNTQTKGINQNILNSFPMNVIDQLEVIRGPGSVLYGTNAYSGVVNVRTDAKNENKNWLEFLAGDYSSRGIEFGSEFEWKGLQALINVKDRHLGVPEVELGGRNEIYRDVEFWQDNRSILLNLDFKGLHIMYADMGFDSPYLSDRGFLRPEQTEVVMQKDKFVNLGYRHDWGEQQLSFDITYNDNRWDERYDKDLSTGDSTLYEVQLKGQLTTDTRYLLGVLQENENYGSPDLLAQKQKYYSAYGQIDHWWTENLKLIAGLQWNKPEFIDSKITPRGSLIWHINHNWSSKLQYSEAYRSPSSVESSANVPGVIMGNPNVEPETIATSEVQVSYTSPGLYTVFSVFDSQLDKLIGLETIDGVRQVRNGEGASYQGLELELKYSLTENLDLSGNATKYQSEVEQQGDNTEAIAPDSMFKFGLAYHYNKWVLGWHNSYFAAPPNYSYDSQNPKAESYWLSSLNVVRALPSVSKQSSVKLYIHNLFDTQAWYPTFSGHPNSLPNEFGRTFTLSFNYAF